MPLEVDTEQRGKVLEATALTVAAKSPITCLYPCHGGSEMADVLLAELYVFTHILRRCL